MNDNVKPLYNGRAHFGAPGPKEQIPHHTDPKDARPIFEPDEGTIERIRRALPGQSRPGVDVATDPIVMVARRLRREHLGEDSAGSYALISAADLDTLLAWVEERA